MQDTGCRIQDAGCRMQDAGCRIQDTGYRIQDTGYRIQDTGYRIQDAGCRMQDTREKAVILRHDVDRKPENALEMAEIERELDIQATYYFRSTEEVFKAEIIQELEKMGHEVGYHYEVLDKTQGNFDIIGEPYLYMCNRYWIS